MEKKYITISMVGFGGNHHGTTFSGWQWMATSHSLKWIKDEALKQMKATWKETLNSECRCTKEYRFFIGLTIKLPGQKTKFMNITIDPKELS